MARIATCGFELGTLATTQGEFDAIQSTPSIQSTTVRTGTYALEITGLASTTAKSISWETAIGTSSGPFFFRSYMKVVTVPSGDNRVIRASTSLTASTVAHVMLTSGGALKLMNGNPGTQVGSTSSAINDGNWHCIEFRFDGSGGAGASILELRIDGSVVATASNLTFSGVIIGFGVGGNLNNETNTAGDWFFDDVALNNSSGSFQNSYPGPGSIFYLHPNGAGDSNTFSTFQVGGTPGSANNYTRVNEIVTDDITSYNGSSVIGASDLFTVPISPMGAGDTVNVVHLNVVSSNNIASASNAIELQLEKISGGTKALSAAFIANNTLWFTNFTLNMPALSPIILYRDPDGLNWTQSTINGMQVGYKIIANGASNSSIVSTLWVVVEYIPSGGTPTPQPLELGLLGVG